MPVYHQPANSVGNHNYNVFFYDNVDYDLHFHKNYEIIYVVSGKVACSVNSKMALLGEGDFAFCLSNEIHSIKSVGDSRVWVGVFSEDFIHEFKKYQNGKTGDEFSFRCSAPLMDYLLKNFIKSELSDVFLIKACLYALCSEYLSQISLSEPAEKKATLMSDIVEYIEENYKKNITLAEMAEGLGYEYCYFSRIFNKLFSMNFTDYINIYRFNAACAMLTETDMSMTDIAYESGFQSIRSFNNIFKRLSGVTPREYRGDMPNVGDLS